MDKFPDTFCPVIRHDLRIGRQHHNRKGQSTTIVQDAVYKGLFHPGYQMSPRIVQMFPYMDGKTALSELVPLLQAKLGMHLSLEALRKVVVDLARYDLLDTPEIRQKRASLEAMFRHTLPRPMCDPSGKFYPADSDILKEAIQHCFLTADKDGLNRKNARLPSLSVYPVAFLLPHGALHSSGHILACALQSLIAAPLPDRYIIIGPNHVYPDQPCATTLSHPFQTPLGVVETDMEMISLLEQYAEGYLIHDYISQYRDHSIEIILPFLQWLHCQSRVTPAKAVRIVPLLLTGERHHPGMSEPESHLRVWQKIGQAIARVLSSSPPQQTIVIVSGDFVHKGPLFQFVPFSGMEQKDFYAWDQPLLQAIEKGDAERFLEAYQASNGCVGRPMYTVLKALKGYHWFMADYHMEHIEENGVAYASFVAYSGL